MPSGINVTHELYDVELLRINAHSATLYFSGGHLLSLARRDELRWWRVGEFGVLRLGATPDGWGWRPYPDQRWRRAPERDDPASGRWGWRLMRADGASADDYLLTHVGVIPGANEALAGPEADSVAIDVPSEFRALCRAYQQTPAAVLRAFMADVSLNRSEVGDASLGSDARRNAQRYFECAHGAHRKVGKSPS